MLNGLLDFGDPDGFSFQAGLGAGWAKSKLINDKDGAFAWQAIAGFTYAVSPNVDIGMRYKYFQTGSLNFHDNTNSATFQRAVTVIDPDYSSAWDRNSGRQGGSRHGHQHEVQGAKPVADPGLQLRRAAAAAATAAAAASAAPTGDADLPGRLGDPGDGRLSASATATPPASAAGAGTRLIAGKG